MKVYAKYVYTLAGDVFAPGFVEYDPTAAVSLQPEWHRMFRKVSLTER